MIAHRLNARGAPVSHGLNPTDPGAPLELLGNLLELHLTAELDLEASPVVCRELVEDAAGEVRLEAHVRAEVDLDEAAAATLRVAERIKVQ